MEIFQFAFMQRAFAAAFLISLISPLLGLFLILRRQSLVADTLSHISLAGVAVGYILGVNPTWSTIVVVALMSLVLEYLRQVYRNYSEVALAFLMAGGMAIALLLMSLSPASAGAIEQYLFGSIVTITNEQVILLAVLSATILILYFFFRRPMYVLTFDEETAFVSGLPVRLISTLFTVLTGVVIAIIMPIVGSLLVSAILIFPAAIAMRLTKYFDRVILIGIIIALIGMFSGLFASYEFGTPPGATIVVIYILIFILSFLPQAFKQHN